MAAPGLLGSLPFLVFLPLTLKRGVVADGDALLYNYPLLHAVVEQWRQGSVPLWNPYTFGGTPLLAFHQAGAMYPLNALCLVSPLWWSMQLSVLLHYSLCGVFAYLLFRRLGLSRWSSLAGGLVFELCGFGQQHIAMATNLRALPWLPLFLYAVEGLAQRDRWRDVAVGAVAIGLAVTAGHPQATVYALITAGAYGAWLLVRIDRGRRRRFVRSLFLLFALGLGLSAVQLLPELAVLRSDASRPPMGFEGLMIGSEHLVGWLGCLFPQVFWPNDWSLFGSYNGLAACAFLGAFLLSARRGFGFDGRVAFFLGLWVVANLLALGRHMPLAHLLSHVPPFGTFKVPTRFGHEAALAAAAIVAFGLQRAFSDALFRRALLVSASLLLVLVGLTALALGSVFRSQATAFADFGTLPVRNLADPVLVRGYLAAAGTWAAIAILWWRPRAWVASALIVASIGLDLAQYARVTGGSQITSPSALAAPPPVLHALRDLEPGQRVMNLVEGNPNSSEESKALLRRNVPALYGIESVNGDDSLVLWRTFMASGGSLKHWGDVDPTRLNEPGLRVFRNLLGARYVLLRPRSAPEIDPPLVTLGRTKLFQLLLNPEALPRLFVVDEALPATTDEAMAAVSTGLRDGKPWDPGRVAWIEGARREELPAVLAERDRPLVGSLELAAGRARGEVSGSAPCVLVHASSFARGWRATIDGRAAPILCADGFLQALIVPAGRHSVEFRYAPSSFVLGLALSALSALLLAAGGLSHMFKRRAVVPLARCLALAVLAPACASVRALAPGEPVRLAPGEAFVFGRVRVFEGQRELTPWNADLLEELIEPGDPDVRVALFRVESEQRALYPVIDADGWFAWALPAGTWFVYRSSQGPPVQHDVLCAFQVQAGNEAQYLGELELHVEVERDSDLQATSYWVEEVIVRSDPDAARALLARRHPDDALELVERPLVSSPELRVLFDDWKRSRAEGVLADLGLRLLPE